MLLNYLRAPQLNAASADETTSAPTDCAGWPHVVVYVTGTGTIASGVLTIEEADINPASLAEGYAGTWSTITTVNASDVTGGVTKAIHLPTGAYAYVRTRISTVLAGTNPTISTVVRGS